MKALIQELQADLANLKLLHPGILECADALRRNPDDRVSLDALGARLHRLYGCLEDMAYRVSVHMNGEVPRGPDSHKQLLERTALEVPGKRRALWRETALEDLHDLRKFRHFFRTRYAIDLDREKLLGVADRALRLIPAAERDILSFVKSLPKT